MRTSDRVIALDRGGETCGNLGLLQTTHDVLGGRAFAIWQSLDEHPSGVADVAVAGVRRGFNYRTSRGGGYGGALRRVWAVPRRRGWAAVFGNAPGLADWPSLANLADVPGKPHRPPKHGHFVLQSSSAETLTATPPTAGL